MNYDSDDIQAERLKQILFPRKTRASSSSIQSSIDQIKQNQEINHKFTIKQQITKLKQGIRNFVGKNTVRDNLLATPRECLELIKCMSERMINYNEQIQQAVFTLIQSIPKPLFRSLHSSKYFLAFLKINHLFNVIYIKRKRNISAGLDSIRKYSQQHKMIFQRGQQKFQDSQFRKQLYLRNKMHLVFNRWRRNATLMRMNETQNYQYQVNIQRSLRTIQMISDQGRMVLYLQRIIESNADFIQILLYNGRNCTLRSYKLENQSLTSVFQSIHNQSQISNLDESIQALNGKIKRLDFDLQHSLTKMCILKKQTLKIQDLRKDPDYGQIDDYTPLFGLSSRQNIGGCIFTPIIYKNVCIGVIRQYFYSRLGQPPHCDIVSQIAQIIQNSIKTHNTFDITKQKSLAIRNNYYLKAVLVLNQIQRIEQFTQKSQEQLMISLCSYFPLKFICEHTYESTKNNVDKPSHFIIKTTKSDHNISNIVVALSKMSQNQTYFLYQSNTLYMKVNMKIFVFEVKRQKESKTQLDHVPVRIIYKLLERKQAIISQKQKQKLDIIRQKQRKQQQAQNRRVSHIKEDILNFFLSSSNVNNQKQLTNLLENYVQTFIKKQSPLNLDFKLKIVNRSKQKIRNYLDGFNFKIYQDQSTLIYIQNSSSVKLSIPHYLLNPLIDFSQYTIQKVKSPIHIPSLDSVNLKSQIHYDKSSLQKSMTNLIKDWLNIEQNLIKSKYTNQNPFVPQSYYCFIQKQVIDQSSTQRLIKQIKNCSTLHPSTLNPINSVIYLNNQLLIIIDNYLDLNEKTLNTLSSVYKRWQLQRDTIKTIKTGIQKQTNIIKASLKMQKVIFISQMRPIFCKIRKQKRSIHYLPDILQNYIYRQNRKLSNYAFNSIKSQANKLKKRKYFDNCKRQRSIKLIIKSIYKLASTHILLKKLQNQKQSTHKLNKFASTIYGRVLSALRSGFHSIFIKKYIRNTNKLSNLEALFRAKLYEGFQNFRRWSKEKQSLEIIQAETECSAISKLDNINSVCKIIRGRFQNYQTYLYLKNGLYLSLTFSKGIQVFQQLKDKSGFQYYQFNSQTKRSIKNTIWLIPQSVTITLVEKHFLQVLSRAIQQSFSKFLYRSQQFLSILNHFAKVKTKNYMSKALSNLRALALSKLKAEQYDWRSNYYQTSVQVQNYKMIQRQQRNQQQQRMQQISQVLQTKKQYEQELAQYRKNIVRFQISSRHLQEAQIRQRFKNQRREKQKAFLIWRTQVAYHKKYTNRRQLARKRQKFTMSNLFKMIKTKHYQNLQYCLRMIMIKAANVRAKARSAHKNNLVETKDFNKNRLLTFQDELNQFVQGEEQQSRTLINIEISPNRNKNNVEDRQISIIPISFKHFESSKKQNYDVTDQEARRLNGGVYKLNAKTLKFLKRMGKINN